MADSGRWMGQAVGALNAWIGDHLASSGNPLHQPLCFYANDQALGPDVAPAPNHGRAAVFVHGLGCNETLWDYPAALGPGSYPAGLAQLGFTPLTVRYNTGARVHENGEALAALLTAYVQRHEVTELVLVGHSMGGLVIRSACHVGGPWIPRVTHAFYLGSPHLGAPLERFAVHTTRVLGWVDVPATRILRDLVDTRSAGVKDLATGSLTRDEAGPIPWLPGIRHHRVVGHVLPSLPGLGDAMVPSESAAAAEAGEDVVVMEGLDHLALMRHPRVLAYLASQLEPSQPVPDGVSAGEPPKRWSRVRGWTRLLHDGVDLGSRFVEKHHRDAAATPFRIVGYVDPTVGRVAEGTYGAALTATYTSIRLVNAAVEVVDTWVVQTLEDLDSE